MNVEEAKRRLMARNRGEKPRPSRMKIIQVSGKGDERREDFVGTVDRWPLRSRSGIFTVRQYDFWLESRDGETVIMATWSIGPGDFDCLEGFVRADGRAGEPDKAARMFDAYESAGFSRTEAVGAVIEDLLDGKEPK
jgi:hypothetical protein